MISVVRSSLQVVVLIVVCHQFHSVLCLKIKKGEAVVSPVCRNTLVLTYCVCVSAALNWNLQPHLLFELLHESVLLPFQQRHFILRLLLLR